MAPLSLSPSAAKHPPPSGPKALRPPGLPARPEPSANGTVAFARPESNVNGKVAFTLPARPAAIPPRDPMNLDRGANGYSSRTNGSSHAESSRHAAASWASSSRHRDDRDRSDSRSRSPQKSRSRSPVKPSGPKTLDSPPHRSTRLASPGKGKDPEYRTKFLPTTEAVRAPISFSIPLSNGRARLERGLPPHLDRALPPHWDRSRPKSPPKAEAPPPPPDEPPPPDDRPPTPPPPEETEAQPPLSPRSPPPSPPLPSPSLPLPSTPPKSPASPPPSSPPRRVFIPLPPPSRVPTPVLSPPCKPVELKEVTPSKLVRDPPPHKALVRDLPPHKDLAQPPPPLREPTPPPPEPWKPHASAERREGLGNFVVLQHPAMQSSKGSKEIKKRYDGIANGQVVSVADPRLAFSDEARQRGRGTAKHKDMFTELQYDWDDHSTGPKPPPPPAAVLITDLNPLTTVDQISKHLRSYGRVREIDSKMDTKSGMQLGICWVKFDGPLSGRSGTGHDVVLNVVKVCNGQRIGLAGNEKITVVLDGRGLRAEKAVKAEMARRYAQKKPAVPVKSSPAPTPRSTERTPISGQATPRVGSIREAQSGPSSSPPVPRTFSNLPARPRAADAPWNNRHRPASNLSRPLGLPPRPAPHTQNLASSFIDAPFAPRERDRDHRDHSPHYDSYRYSRRSRSRSRSRSRRARSHSCSTCSSYSDSEDDRPIYRRRGRSPSPRRGRAVRREDSTERKENEAATARVQKALSANGLAYILIETTALPYKSVSEEHLKDHFRMFKPSQVLSAPQGWYILFSDNFTAQRARILDSTIVQGHRLVIQVRSPSTQQPQDSAMPAIADTAARGSWKLLTIGKKNRPPVKPVARPRSPSVSSSSSDESEAPVRRRSPSASSVSELSDVIPARQKTVTLKSPESDAEVSLVIPPASDTATPSDITQDEPAPKGKKRPAKQVAKKTKKARITSPILDVPVQEIKLEMDIDVPAPIVEIKEIPEPKAKPKKAPKTAVEKLFESGAVEDQEDAYWLGMALAAAHDNVEPDLSDDEEELLDEKHPLYHTSGAWRAEGWKKIPQIAKSSYLPQRNQAQVSVEDTANPGLTSGRTARVTGRRLAHDMETTRKTTIASTAESDLFAFNQLRIRKKQLRFARSAIEGYGLYAMETIQPGEMVCEYVGEICRSAVAEIREQRYLKQGIGSSYLFRIDGDMICDATFRGSVSRLINHSCDPTASAKIISINGHSKIVIYAKSTLLPGEEILYDYKFPLETDPALRVPCLCGSKMCRGWLN